MGVELRSVGVVRLGGPKVRKRRGTAADPLDRGDVFMHQDSSIAPIFGPET